MSKNIILKISPCIKAVMDKILVWNIFLQKYVNIVAILCDVVLVFFLIDNLRFVSQCF